MMKVVSVVGTRPEVIKMAPVVKALQQLPDYFQASARVTSLHREIPDQVLSQFRIISNLYPNSTCSAMTSMSLTAVLFSWFRQI